MTRKRAENIQTLSLHDEKKPDLKLLFKQLAIENGTDPIPRKIKRNDLIRVINLMTINF